MLIILLSVINGIVDIQENVFFLMLQAEEFRTEVSKCPQSGGNDSANINRKPETVNKENWQLSNLA